MAVSGGYTLTDKESPTLMAKLLDPIPRTIEETLFKL